jgi:hypothetical protein
MDSRQVFYYKYVSYLLLLVQFKIRNIKYLTSDVAALPVNPAVVLLTEITMM